EPPGRPAEVDLSHEAAPIVTDDVLAHGQGDAPLPEATHQVSFLLAVEGRISGVRPERRPQEPTSPHGPGATPGRVDLPEVRQVPAEGGVDESVEPVLVEPRGAVHDRACHPRTGHPVEPAAIGPVEAGMMHDGAFEPPAGGPWHRHMGRGRPPTSPASRSPPRRADGRPSAPPSG